MSDWPVINQSNTFGSPIAMNGILVEGHASAHTKSNWYELTAATRFESEFIVIYKRYGDTGRTYLIDIGIGAAGSETVVINNLLVSVPANYQFGAVGGVVIPLRIPKGARVAARHQASAGSVDVYVGIYIVGAGFLSSGGFSNVITYGVNTASTVGTEVDPGATANILGAYVQLVASLSHDIKGFFIAVCKRNRTSTHARFQMFPGIGAAGSEVNMAPYHDCGTATAGSDLNNPFSTFYPISLKAGSRISVAAMCSTNSSPARLFDCAFYGVY